MKKNIIFSAIGVIVTFIVAAQDYRFTQYYANPLRLNPAIMGANPDLKFILDYRNQWNSIQKGFSTMSFTGMYPLYIKSGGKLDVGVSMINDKTGAFKTNDVALAVDYSKEIAADQTLCLALMGGVAQKSLDVSNLTFDNQYVLGVFNPNNPSDEQLLKGRVNYPDVGFGLTWYMNPSREKSKLNAFAGVSGFHLNKPNQSLTGAKGTLPIRMTYIGGVKIFGDKKIDVSPNVRMVQQAGNTELSAGVSVDYNLKDNMKVVIGSWYRRGDAIAFLAGFSYQNYIFGYSYDAITSSLRNNVARAAAHEITLSYKLRMKPKVESPSLDAGGGKMATGENPFSDY
ncbi:MAG TPA: PorP/SprF family type IX secretion system membrane protein [Bacteroidia bacterium]